MKSCGIDLGTTNSCIHVVEAGGLRLVPDAQGNPTVPSVVHQTRDGRILVGHAARNRFGELPAPVATVKRKMGSDETVPLGGERRTPVEVSALILRHLKELAEATVGETVERAVVTVPAYFAHIQRQQTDEAARAAGFREVTTLLEPVAAALAYSLESERSKLRVFVYDLGGGTFDATVLEKDADGSLSVLSFGGDPFLGGDDFDARLTRLLLERLKAKNFRLDLKLDDPQDFARYQRLKFFAETAKIGLSESDSVDLVHQALFSDQDGELIDLDVRVTREELESCCSDLVERSITESLLTLEKKQIAHETIDEVIMVGGMSYMPLVRRRLQEALGKVPRLVDPALIVSRGAALKAAQLFPERVRGEGALTVDLTYDRRTSRERVRISGATSQPLPGAVVYLFDASSDRSMELAAGTRFAFDNVPLIRDAVNRFTVSIDDAEGNAVFGTEIEILQDAGFSDVRVSPGSVVTKAIAVRTLDGPLVLFEENTTLPHAAAVALRTADQGGMIQLPILEGSHEVQRLVIRDIPRDLPVGSEVRMEVTIQADYQIHAKARVAAIEREVAIAFRIEPLSTAELTPDYIRTRLAELEARADREASACRRASEVEVFRVRFAGLVESVRMELEEPEPHRLKIRERLVAMHGLVEQIALNEEEAAMPGLDFEGFTQKLVDLEAGAIEARHPELAKVRPRIAQLRRDAADAWRGRDRVAWLQCARELSAVAGALLPKLSDEEKSGLMASYILGHSVPELEAKAGPSRELEQIKLEAVQVLRALQAGAMAAEEAVARLVGLYKSKVEPLLRRHGLETEDLEDVPSRKSGTGITKAVR